ncbi:hypothetical protein L6R52_04085 [Myxococcota bacterium]|nr:hypothetical protein [Myxococcota bacterium]
MRRTQRRRARGFTALLVIVIVALMTLVSLTLLDQVGLDLLLVGEGRRTVEAKALADSAVFEVANDQRTGPLLPDFTSHTMAVTVRPHTGSVLASRSDRSYEGSIRLLRFVPLGESSQSWSRALVYELSIDATAANGDATDAVRTEVYKTVAVPADTVFPRRHAR